MKEKRLLPIGTKVFDIRFGWGKVTGHHSVDYKYPIRIYFDFEYRNYTADGFYIDTDKKSILSLTEYTLENGGFTPISEYWNRPQIGDWGFFWDYTHTNTAIFTQLKDIDSDNKFHTSTAKWDNFSHEIPPYIKKQMEQ